MKPNQFFQSIKSGSVFAAGIAGLLVLSDPAEAVVTVCFAQDGLNVTATVSGTLWLPNIAQRTINDGPSFAPAVGGDSSQLFGILAGFPSFDIYQNGSASASGLSVRPDSFSGTISFGYQGSTLIVDPSSAPDGILTPAGVWTWNNNTLAGIGLGSLTTTPIEVYMAGTHDDTIQFVACAVPEPSTALLGLGATALMFRRKRTMA